jgi:3-carboxy-cis,cis-muconate cycloisomerase
LSDDSDPGVSLLDPLFRWPAVSDLFSDGGRIQGMLDFESALASALARSGVIPATAASTIGARCRTELFDGEALGREAGQSGNPVIPLVRRLTTLVAEGDPGAARFVHWGATSQDALDTGFVLQLRQAFVPLDAELARLAEALARLALAHRGTPMAARTWMQHALPTTFGVKAAGWLDAIGRHRRRLRGLRGRALVLQFGGAAGTLAALGDKGNDVARALAQELGLGLPDLPWHSHRDRVVEVATTLGLATGTLGKIARDLSLHMQTEVAELGEPSADGRGGSSTMPHKRNPVACGVVLAAATRMPGLVSSMLGAMIQEDERGLGGGHAEWEVLPEIVGLFGGALHHLTDAIAGLEVDPARMRENLEATRGLIFAEAVQMALGPALGRAAAHDLLQAASRQARAQRRHLREVLAADATVSLHLSPERLAELFEPRSYLGMAEALVDRVLAAHQADPGPGEGD